MSWVHWALLSAIFAGVTAVLAKVGVRDIDSNLATAIRTVVILIFAWLIAWRSGPLSLATVSVRTWLFLALSGVATGASDQEHRGGQPASHRAARLTCRRASGTAPGRPS